MKHVPTSKQTSPLWVMFNIAWHEKLTMKISLRDRVNLIECLRTPLNCTVALKKCKMSSHSLYVSIQTVKVTLEEIFLLHGIHL